MVLKSPGRIQDSLKRYWKQPKRREAILLSHSEWPLEFSIGAPTGKQIDSELKAVKQHIDVWRTISEDGPGVVEWKEKQYRLMDEPLIVPVKWQLSSSEEYVEAADDIEIRRQFVFLTELFDVCDEQYHAFCSRHLKSLMDAGLETSKKVLEIGVELEPGSAHGIPLRALQYGVDTKFLEQNENLLVQFLCERFDSPVPNNDLAEYLGASRAADHWLLVADPMKERILPFKEIRVRSSDLKAFSLPVSRILLIENEQCLHLLPKLCDCLVILGFGNDLGWLQGRGFTGKSVRYWGDLDTAGLDMLGSARQYYPGLESILMDKTTFERCKSGAVKDTIRITARSMQGLTDREKSLYQHLLSLERGRLEQEFLYRELVLEALSDWM